MSISTAPRHLATLAALLVLAGLLLGAAEPPPQLAGDPGLVLRQDGSTWFVRARAGALMPAPAALQAAPPAERVQAWLRERAGLGDEQLRRCVLHREHAGGGAGLRTLVWHQEHDGIAVHDARIVANLGPDGALLTLACGLAEGVPRQALGPGLAVDQALLRVLAACGSAAPGVPLALTAAEAADPSDRQQLSAPGAQGAVHAWREWRAAGGSLVPAWRFVLVLASDGLMYDILADADSGALLERKLLTCTGCFAAALAGEGHHDHGHETELAVSDLPLRQPVAASPTPPVSAAAASRYRVFERESPTPQLPGWPSSQTTQPATVARSLQTVTELVSDASPDGWLDASQTTVGNNVLAGPDRNGNNLHETRPAASGSPPTFDPALDLGQAPSNHTDAATVNLFYWCNVAHDRLWALGFTEAAGNFQDDNFGRGGLGGDPVVADAQDGSGTDNANFSPTVDGVPPRLQMFEWTGTTPRRDGDFDATIILHEYVHGLSFRMVAGGGALFALQSRGMGEGWSDFYALALLVADGTDPYATYQVGAYAVAGFISNNHYRGIRRYPYAAESGASLPAGLRNPLTFADIASNSEVHRQGEVWCQMLWELRAELIGKYGSALGNQRCLELVTDGMRLTAPNPGFVDARDGILLAGLARSGGADQALVWRAFAKRGLGFSAVQGDSDSVSGVGEAFDLPPALHVTRLAPLRSGGAPGGPFDPPHVDYSLVNMSDQTLSWSASTTDTWVTALPASSTIPVGGHATVRVAVAAAASAFPAGARAAEVVFRRDASEVLRDPCELHVSPPYQRDDAAAFAWFDTASKTTYSAGDDTVSGVVSLPFPFPFYTLDPSGLRIASNGLIGLENSAVPDGAVVNPNRPLPNGVLGTVIAPWWDDLDPSAGGSIRRGSFGSAQDRYYVVSWHNVPRFGQATPGNGFSFQVALGERHHDILLQYQQVRSGDADGGAGRSATIGLQGPVPALGDQYGHDGSHTVANGQCIRYSLGGRTVALTVRAAADAVLVDTTVSHQGGSSATLAAGTPSALFRALPVASAHRFDFQVPLPLAPGGIGRNTR